MKYLELTREEYEAVIEAREVMNELFGFGKKSNLDNTKNKAVGDIKSTANDIDEEKKRREEMRQKLLAMKK